MLLEAGANTATVDTAGVSALMEACKEGHDAIIDLLLRHHAGCAAPRCMLCVRRACFLYCQGLPLCYGPPTLLRRGPACQRLMRTNTVMDRYVVNRAGASVSG